MSEPGNVKPKAQVRETIRQWYQRTTAGARKFLLVASVIALGVAVIVFLCAPQKVHHALQQFNGAYTIPVAGAIWILGFLYIFLIPQREVGFRTQEFVESMSNSVKDTIEKEIVPAVLVWKRVGEKLEAELPVFMKKIDEGILEIREASKKLSVAVEKNEGLAAEAKPAIEALRRIEARVEDEIKNGLFEKVSATMDSVRMMGGLPAQDEEKEDPSFALNSIRKNKAVRRVQS